MSTPKDKKDQQQADVFTADDALAEMAMDADQAEKATANFAKLKSRGARGVAQHRLGKHASSSVQKANPAQPSVSEKDKKEAGKNTGKSEQAKVKPQVVADAQSVPASSKEQSIEKPAVKKKAPENSPSASVEQNTTPANPLGSLPDAGQKALLGSIKPANVKKASVPKADFSKSYPSNIPDNHVVNVTLPKNPLLMPEASQVKPTMGSMPPVERALSSIMQTAGAFDTNSIQVQKSGDQLQGVTCKTETGYQVDTDGLKFDLLGTEENARDADLDLTLEVRSMLQAAKSMGWSQLDITGTPAFIAAAKQEAAILGVELVTSIEQAPSNSESVAAVGDSEKELQEFTKNSQSANDTMSPTEEKDNTVVPGYFGGSRL